MKTKANNKKQRPHSLVCYKEGRTQKWIMTSDDNDEEILIELMINPKIDNSTIFVIPVSGLMFGGIRLDDSNWIKLNFFKFFEEFGKKQPKIQVSDNTKEIIAKSEAERREKLDSKYGFISPNGKYFRCEFEGHHDLAYDICTYRYDIDINEDPERYLEEHGWCKIYNPFLHNQRYAVYVNDKLTKDQYETLQKLGLENAKHISVLL